MLAEQSGGVTGGMTSKEYSRVGDRASLLRKRRPARDHWQPPCLSGDTWVGGMARSFPFDGASFALAITPTAFGLWNFASVRIRWRKRTVRRFAVRSPEAADAQAGQLASCSGAVRARAYGRATLPLRGRSHPTDILLRWNHPRKWIFGGTIPNIVLGLLFRHRWCSRDIFLKIGRAARRRFCLIRIRRMNRLSGDLFGVPSHICTTSIEAN